MGKINKIKLSGTTYEVEDKEAVKTVTLTQAEYDALQTKDPSIFYVISDGQGGGGSGSSAVEVTQAEYDALVSGGTLDPSVLYIITDAVGGDLSNYMTSAQTMNAISAATSTKQDILSAGTGIDITDNTISVTGGSGGGKAIEGGRGITVTTGATADTVSFNLPLSSSTLASDSIVGGYYANYSMAQYGFAFGDNAKCGNSGSACIALGRNVTANGTGAIALGSDNTAKGKSVAIGQKVNSNLEGEIALGIYNVSSTASNTFGDSGNTLFSVGNGTANNARHNAFEIKQNGDIYITSGSTDIKLQDHLGGGGGGGLDDDTQLLLSTALTDLNDRKADLSEVRQNYQRKGDYATKSELAAKANVSDVMTLEKAKENEQVTSYALNNLNNRVTDNTTALGGMKLVKLTQSEYTALTTKDENTLYVVIADPE